MFFLLYFNIYLISDCFPVFLSRHIQGGFPSCKPRCTIFLKFVINFFLNKCELHHLLIIITSASLSLTHRLLLESSTSLFCGTTRWHLSLEMRRCKFIRVCVCVCVCLHLIILEKLIVPWMQLENALSIFLALSVILPLLPRLSTTSHTDRQTDRQTDTHTHTRTK